MARPTLKEQRRAEILDAYARCAARFGLDGATQDRIAAEAGVARPLLRHNLGNKDEMIRALAEHVVSSFNAMTEELISYDLAVPEIVAALFDPDDRIDRTLILAFQALITAAGEDQTLRAPLLDCLTRLTDHIDTVIADKHPAVVPATRRAVATGVVAIYSSYESLTPLSPGQEWYLDHRAAALALAATLEVTA